MEFALPRRVARAAALLLTIAGAGASAGAADLAPRHVPAKPDSFELWEGLRDDLLIVKFVEGSVVRARDGRLVSQANRDLAAANRILMERPGLVTSRLFTRDEASLARDRDDAQLRSGKAMADLDNYYRVDIARSSPEAAEALLAELNALDVVEIAYAEPIPQVALFRDEDETPRRDGASFSPPGAGAPGTPDFEPMQGYLGAAPTGIDAYAAWNFDGGRGETVKVIDIELGWNWTHEDHKEPFFQGGSVTYDNHGVAVVGEIMSQDNGYGTTGIASAVEIGGYSVYDIPTADAFERSAAALDPGDIYVIELHCPGPGGPFIALEWWQANFDVISTATARGVICVAAAGNGSADFDHARYEGRFDRAVRDSGAVIVGATAGASLAPASFSNHGTRVDLAGWGQNVTTTGYGNLQGGPQNQWYTSSFSGTSSATPIVVGAVAAMQGIYKARTGGTPLDGQTIVEVLRATGTPTTGPQLIGPRPNLALAVPAMLDDLTSISGVVTGSEGGGPIEGVEMRVVETGTRSETAADGTYELLILAGDWTVRATAFGYDLDETVVPAGPAKHDVALDSIPTYELSGRVRDESGGGVQNAEVSLPGTPLPPVVTGSGGAYAIAGVPETHEGTVVATASGLTPDVRLVGGAVAGAGGGAGAGGVDLRLAAPDDFEAGSGGFVGTGQWQWGVPAFDGGPDAHSGVRCWGTNLTGNYSPSDMFLTTPDFDLAGLVDPRLAFWHWYAVFGTYDGVNVEISTNGGGTWQVLHPVAGYPDSCIDGIPGAVCEPGWAGSTHAWVPAAFDLDAYAGQTVRFRFTLGSWGFTGSPGWYIDDLAVHGAGGDPCPWDLDEDDAVDFDDLLDLLSQWGTDPGGPPDFDEDGDVGFADLLVLLSRWGPCPR